MSEIAAARRAIGLIVPSSNRVVERVASHVLAGRPDIDYCIARVPYGGISTGDGYLPDPFDRASLLLADAGVDVICWNATRGAALGFAVDRDLCRRVQILTGIPAVTTSLATLALLRRTPRSRVGLITQGDAAESEHLVDRFRAEGIEIVDHLWLGIANNLDAATVDGGALLGQARRLADRAATDAILVWSTNLSGYAARLFQGAERGFAILDAAEIGINAALAHVSFAPDPDLPIK